MLGGDHALEIGQVTHTQVGTPKKEKGRFDNVQRMGEYTLNRERGWVWDQRWRDGETHRVGDGVSRSGEWEEDGLRDLVIGSVIRWCLLVDP